MKVTRSWKVHNQSNRKTPQQDFVKINKIAVKQGNVGKVRIINLYDFSRRKNLEELWILRKTFLKVQMKGKSIYQLKISFMEGLIGK